MDSETVLLVTSTDKHTSGTVNFLDNIYRGLAGAGYRPEISGPANSSIVSIDCGFMSLSVPSPPKFLRLLRNLNPTFVHHICEETIAQMSIFCLQAQGLRYTASVHTDWPGTLTAMLSTPHDDTWEYLQWVYEGASRIMVPTPTYEDLFREKGIRNDFVRVGRGIGPEFHPRPRLSPCDTLILLWVGRLSSEKGLCEFLDLDVARLSQLIGKKVQMNVIGPDNDLKAHELRGRCGNHINFLGAMSREELAVQYCNSDILLFTSRNDVVPNVPLEANASGIPCVGGYYPGPIDYYVDHPLAGVVTNDWVEGVVLATKRCTQAGCLEFAAKHTWEGVTQAFIKALVPARLGIA